MILLPALVGLFDWAGWVNLFWAEAAGRAAITGIPAAGMPANPPPA